MYVHVYAGKGLSLVTSIVAFSISLSLFFSFSAAFDLESSSVHVILDE